MIRKLKEYGVWLLLAGVVMLMYKFVDNYQDLFAGVGRLIRLLTPFFWGFTIAYFLNPLLIKIQKNLKLKKVPAIVLTYAMFLGVLTIFGFMVVPVIVSNISEIIQYLPSYSENIQKLFDTRFTDFEIVKQLNLESYLENHIGEFSRMAVNFLNSALNSVFQSIIGVTSGLIKFLVGIIISLYILFDKERFVITGNKVIHAYYGPEKSEQVREFFRMSDGVFKNFFIGKAIDSAIIGVICYIGMVLMKIPYAALLSICVGLFNMIPYIGPFIGAFPAVVITLFSGKPIMALWVSVFILILQQVDGNIIGPKILGDKVGVSPFYILLAITIGGGYFGILGMLVAVPLFKIIGIQINKHLDKKIISNKSV